MSNLTSGTHRYRLFFWRYHLTIFFTLATAAIALAMLSLLGVIEGSAVPEPSANQSQINFNAQQSIISTLEQLQTTSPGVDQFPPPTTSRTDPFTE